MASQEQLYQWRRPDSIAHSKELARMVFYIAPVMWGVKMYDAHWASKSVRQAEMHEITRRAKGDWSSDVPVPLPRVRKRALTGPLPPIESIPSLSQSIRRSRQRTENQPGSGFLTAVPYEIRLQVYEEVLIGAANVRLIHMLRKHGRFGHWRCRMQDDGPGICDPSGLRCVEGWLAYRAKLYHLDKAGMLSVVTDGGLVALLQTCRIMQVSPCYSEAINILYAKHSFHFHDPGDLRYFGRTVLPQRLNSITSVVMDWERMLSIFSRDTGVPRMDNEEWRAWAEAWSIIKKMESLKELKVILKPHKYEVSNERRRKMCGPMMEVRNVRTFELYIPFDDKNDWSFAVDAPFRIVREAQKPEDEEDA